jgi:uncharacterized membrane protein YphA (DoxX/SURF4 family)
MKRWLVLLLRVGLGALFGVAGAAKLADTTAFAIQIHNYQLLPGLAPFIAVVLPPVELAAAAAMLFGRKGWIRAGACVATILLAAFTIAVTSVLVRGINVSCGCFGLGSGPVTGTTVIRNVLLLGAALSLFFRAADGSAWTADSVSSTLPGSGKGMA